MSFGNRWNSSTEKVRGLRATGLANSRSPNQANGTTPRAPKSYLNESHQSRNETRVLQRQDQPGVCLSDRPPDIHEVSRDRLTTPIHCHAVLHHENNGVMTCPALIRCGRPRRSVIVVSGSIPRAVKIVAPRSAGYQPRVAGYAA